MCVCSRVRCFRGSETAIQAALWSHWQGQHGPLSQPRCSERRRPTHPHTHTPHRKRQAQEDTWCLTCLCSVTALVRGQGDTVYGALQRAGLRDPRGVLCPHTCCKDSGSQHRSRESGQPRPVRNRSHCPPVWLLSQSTIIGIRGHTRVEMDDISFSEHFMWRPGARGDCTGSVHRGVV